MTICKHPSLLPNIMHRYCTTDAIIIADVTHCVQYTTVRKPIGSDSSIINYLRAIFNTPTSPTTMHAHNCTHNSYETAT